MTELRYGRLLKVSQATERLSMHILMFTFSNLASTSKQLEKKELLSSFYSWEGGFRDINDFFKAPGELAVELDLT